MAISKKILILYVLISLLLFAACEEKNDCVISDNYWQTDPKLAMVLNDDVSIKDVFHYEEFSIDKNKNGIKKVLHSSDMKLLKYEIIAYRETSDEKVIIITFDETYSTGFISKDIFKENFSTDSKEMIKLGEYAFIKSGAHIYNEQFNIERTVEGYQLESLPVGKILERGDTYYKVSYNPDGTWIVLVKKEDLKYDGIFRTESTNAFTL